MHGWGVAQRIQQVSKDVLQIGQGSLYPALHRLEYKGWIRADWGSSENNRRAKFYRLTARGQEDNWRPSLKRGSGCPADRPGAGADSGGVVMMTELLTRLRFLLSSRRSRARLDEELRFIWSRRSVAAKHAAGMTAEEARRQALIEFGGMERTREQCHRAAARLVDGHGGCRMCAMRCADSGAILGVSRLP
jgi:DNA-binding PadR family transcriptional regulator